MHRVGRRVKSPGEGPALRCRWFRLQAWQRKQTQRDRTNRNELIQSEGDLGRREGWSSKCGYMIVCRHAGSNRTSSWRHAIR
jgi:hypothetical protein